MIKLLEKNKRIIPLADQAIVSGGNFLVGILLTRGLGLELYGEFTLLWLIVLFCNSIQQAGILNPMYTFAPQYAEEKKENYFNQLLQLQLLFTLVFSLLCVAFMQFHEVLIPSWGLSEAAYVLPFTVSMYLMYDFFRRLNYSKEKILKVFIMDGLIYLFQMVSLIIFHLQGTLSLKLALLIIGISFSLVFLFSFRELFMQLKTPLQLRELVYKHWHFSKWLVGTSLLQWFSGNFFILAAASILSPVAVGAIRIIQNIIGLLHVLFLAFENVIPLKASELFNREGLSAMGGYIRKMMLKGALATFAIGILMAVFGKQIMSLLYNGQHLEYAYLIYGFAGLYVVVFIGTIIRFTIRTLEKTQIIFIAYVISSAISMLVAKPIIQYFGINGIVIGLLMSQLIIQACFIYSLRSNLKEICGLSTSY